MKIASIDIGMKNTMIVVFDVSSVILLTSTHRGSFKSTLIANNFEVIESLSRLIEQVDVVILEEQLGASNSKIHFNMLQNKFISGIVSGVIFGLKKHCYISKPRLRQSTDLSELPKGVYHSDCTSYAHKRSKKISQLLFQFCSSNGSLVVADEVELSKLMKMDDVFDCFAMLNEYLECENDFVIVN